MGKRDETPRKWVYLSGKVTGMDKEATREYFARYQKHYEERGYAVFDPMEKAETYIEGYKKIYQGTAPSEEGVMLYLILELSQCDIVAMLPGWENSYGAQIERLWAMRHGKEVMYAE